MKTTSILKAICFSAMAAALPVGAVTASAANGAKPDTTEPTAAETAANDGIESMYEYTFSEDETITDDGVDDGIEVTGEYTFTFDEDGELLDDGIEVTDEYTLTFNEDEDPEALSTAVIGCTYMGEDGETWFVISPEGMETDALTDAEAEELTSLYAQINSVLAEFDEDCGDESALNALFERIIELEKKAGWLEGIETDA